MATVADQVRARGRWRSQALGLAIDSAFPLVGCAAEPDSLISGLRPVSLELSEPGELRNRFAEDSRAIGWRRRPTGEPVEADVLAHPTAGYLMLGHAETLNGLGTELRPVAPTVYTAGRLEQRSRDLTGTQQSRPESQFSRKCESFA